MAVHGELAGPLEPFSVAVLKRNAESPRVLVHAQIGSERHVVVVRRGLAMHTVRANVGQEVTVELVQDEVERDANLQAGQRQQ